MDNDKHDRGGDINPRDFMIELTLLTREGKVEWARQGTDDDEDVLFLAAFPADDGFLYLVNVCKHIRFATTPTRCESRENRCGSQMATTWMRGEN